VECLVDLGQSVAPPLRKLSVVDAEHIGLAGRPAVGDEDTAPRLAAAARTGLLPPSIKERTFACFKIT
jgi:hypothetical protein